jgi:hypothetical protein
MDDVANTFNVVQPVVYGGTGGADAATARTNLGIVAASTTAAGLVELATNAETIAGTDNTRAITPATAYFPTGFVYGLTLTTAAGDPTNDVVMATGAARSDDDTTNIVQGSTYTKQVDATWVAGNNAGGRFYTTLVNGTIYIYAIRDTTNNLVDWGFSDNATTPTGGASYPAAYTKFVKIGEVVRAGGVNGTPLWYGSRRASVGYAGITLATPVASTSGTSIDFTSIPAWAKRVTVNFDGVSTSGTSNVMLQIGDSGGIETTGYLGAAGSFSTVASADNFTTGFGVLQSVGAGAVSHGSGVLSLLDPATNTWAWAATLGRSNAALVCISGGSKSLSAVLDRVRLTTVGGTDTFDLGKVNISYE